LNLRPFARAAFRTLHFATNLPPCVAAKTRESVHNGDQTQTRWEIPMPDWFVFAVPLVIYFAIYPGELRSTRDWLTGLFQ
jgi:hypothetical protein